MKYSQHQKPVPALEQQGKLSADPEASRLWQRRQHRKQVAMRTHRQVQDAVHLGPVGGTETEERGSLQHPFMSEKLPDEHSWDRNTTLALHPSHATERESTRDAAPVVPHRSTGSRNNSAEEALGRTDNSSVRRRKEQNEAAPTPRPPHHTNNHVLSIGPQGEGADSVKGSCTCLGSSVQVQDPHTHQLALAQKGTIAKGREGLLQRPYETHIPTPRTEEAVWAAAALTFLFVLLTLAVLYTRLYRNFRRSRSLYWDLGSDCEGQESVASVIKRRLLSRQSRRKRWHKQRQPPLLLHEDGSESSE